MRGLKYAFNEAMASLLRGWRSAILAVLTIAAGLFVLGFSLVVNTNLQRIVGRWAEAAELSIFLRDDITREQLAAVDDLIGKSGLAAERQYVSKQAAVKRFAEDFPDLAPTAQALEQSPFPASFDVKLNQQARDAGAAVDTFATTGFASVVTRQQPRGRDGHSGGPAPRLRRGRRRQSRRCRNRESCRPRKPPLRPASTRRTAP